MTFMEFNALFPTEKAVVDYFIKIRYPDGIACNHCGSTKVYPRTANIKVFDCNDCRNTFSPFKDTIFEKSSTSLIKWMYAIHLILNGKKGISGLQLQREIGVTYKTAWRMLQQIRIAMNNAEHKQFVDTIVEIDETYVGGKPRKGNRKDDDDPPKGNGGGGKNKVGRDTDKTPVIGVVSRDDKAVFARVALPNDKGQKLTATQLIDVLKVVSKPENGNVVMTDEFSGYAPLAKHNYVHLMIDHSKMFSDGEIHTNNIEGFWSILKRGIFGIYHHISVKHMQRYIDEFCFRYNQRKNDGVFDLVLKQALLE